MAFRNLYTQLGRVSSQLLMVDQTQHSNIYGMANELWQLTSLSFFFVFFLQNKKHKCLTVALPKDKLPLQDQLLVLTAWGLGLVFRFLQLKDSAYKKSGRYCIWVTQYDGIVLKVYVLVCW